MLKPTNSLHILNKEWLQSMPYKTMGGYDANPTKSGY